MENSSVFGLRHQARCLASVKKSTEKSKFLAGTVGAKENVVCLLEYDDDSTTLSSVMYNHPDEVWDIASSPSDEDLFFTCHSPVSGNPMKSKATLWHKSNESIENGQQDLTALMILESEGIKKLIIDTHPVSHSHNYVYTKKTILSVDVSSMFSNEMNSPALQQLQNAVWNKHHRELVTVGGCAVSGWDLRSGKTSFQKLDAHQSTIRAVDCNPNKPHHLVTGGDDALVQLWDARQLTKPVIMIKENSHWVWSAAFNPLQDQLLLTSSSDALVHLHNVYSVSSAANVEDDDDEEERREKPKDGLICSYDQHEDSVYNVTWSPADAWTFASLSYSGRVVISQVPLEEKFKILGSEMLLDKLWADMLCLDRFDTDEWCYVGEGNANIVMRYIGSEQKLKGKVLRVKKEQEFTKQAALFSQQFIEKVVTRLLGKEYVVHYEMVHVTQDFLSSLANSIELNRPSFRLKKKVNCNSTAAILLKDLTQQWYPNSAFTFELKPKWGFKSYSRSIKDHKVKESHCRYCMHSHYRKLMIGEYCPLDLYSRDAPRVKRAIHALIKNPHLEKTLKIFCGHGDNNLFLKDNQETILEMIIIQDPILTKLQTLQRQLDSLDIEDIMSIYGKYSHQLQEPDIATWEKTVKYYETRSDDSDEMQQLYEYVLSMTFKDCSILINIRQTNEEKKDVKYIQYKGIYVEYDIKVIDVDAKSIHKVPYWFELDQTIDRDFEIGNLPEGLNVAPSSGAPKHLNTVSLDLKQDVNQFGLAGKIWQSAYTLQALFSPDTRSTLEPSHPIPEAYYLSSTEPIPQKPYRILELGAGTGYVGISLANHLRAPAEVTITDLEQVVPLIQENVNLHYHQTPDSAKIIVDRLHWGNQEDNRKHGKAL
ncbi:hypothetical protein G6F22_002380 [Rhizopus arrhizus]|nr:hypothetical protein G6F22_002380 [Rhizopus arrhizus]